MWGWFGGAGVQKRKDGPKNAILMLRQQLDMLQKRERHLQNQMKDQDAVARKNIATNKTAAKAALRRKRMHERSLEQTNAQIDQVEDQIQSIESANINQETLNAMKTAGKAMKEIHGNLTIDKVDATMDELREQHAIGEEIANAISSAPLGEPINEEDLDAELEDMEQEMIDERMLETGAVPVADLPVVANGPIKGKNKVQQKPEEEDEEEELRKLQAEMAM